ncbi:hypothetical protein FA95DRAFT_1524689 [Auriscalpium vulgare]|uniref:Uncharacterized protein n=1 Tax=Auriscalpium vulgare TaxID=40419 RepID=A0ACB8RGK4_9AGAM|nr:hypothetical protein FA95DRAFT_1524689 [Auriscalpium vulgare]
MWVVTGPFDGAAANDVSHQVGKLLKSGKQYKIGRRDCDILVNHKRVSAEHCLLVVGGFTPDDVADPEAIPRLEVTNCKKPMHFHRDGLKQPINPHTPHILEDGDVLDIIGDVPLTFRWQRICCYETPGRGRPPVSIDGCAALGISVVRAHHPNTTHHVISSYSLTPAIAASLLTATHFVKPDWLQKVLHLGMLEKDELGALETKCDLPPETKHRPGFSAALAPALKTFATWEPNEARLNMLRGCRFLFVGEKGREISAEYQTLLTRGSADYEAFTVTAGVARWRKLLAKGQAWAQNKKGKLVLVADDEAMTAAVGATEWEEIDHEAKSLKLQFILPENILQAIAHIDTFYLDSPPLMQTANSSKLPSFAPNTHPEEPTIPPELPAPMAIDPVPAPSRVTRASSRAPSEPPASKMDETADAPRPARRPPPRRAAGRARNHAELLGLDDSIIDDEPTPSTSKSVTPAPVQPTPIPKPPSIGSMTQSRSARPPRRRAPGSSTNINALIGLDDDTADSKVDTQLNKYKALFEASDPDRVAESQLPPTATQTQTQTGTGSGTTGTIYHALEKVAEEEEEETQAGRVPGSQRGTKRKVSNEAEMQEMLGDPDADMPDDAPAPAPVKRRAVEGVNAVKPTSTASQSATATGTQAPHKLPTFTKPASTDAAKKTGAKPGEPDKDEQFLKACTARGKKKKADELDKEFNALRISKPELQEASREDWVAVLHDFGNTDVRGNFMQIVEIDIDTNVEPVSRVRTGGRQEWIGKPDYKKFKKQTVSERRPVVELVVSEENDYDIGTAYTGWRTTQAPRSQDAVERIPARAKTQTQRKGKARAFVASDGSGDEEAPAPPARKGKAKATPAPAVKSRSRSASRASSRAPAALFLSDEEDEGGGGKGRLAGLAEAEELEMADDPDADEDGAPTTLTMGTNATQRETQETAPRAVRRTAVKRKARAVEDGDSDDGAFKGFRNKKKGRLAS